MTDRPIIFSGPMVRALLDGRKTQTRRLLKPQPPAQPEPNCHPSHEQKHPAPYLDSYCGEPRTPQNPRGMSRNWHWWQVDNRPGPIACRVPYAPGDRLWVREDHYRFGHWEPVPGVKTKAGRMKWRFVEDDAEVRFDPPDLYRKGRHHKDPYTPAWHFRAGRFMFRRHSRLTLTVTDVRVQRLQDISEADAKAEGAKEGDWPGRPDCSCDDEDCVACSHYPALCKPAFRHIWNSLHGADAWGANPWVVALTFTVQRGNIDEVTK